MHSISSHSYNYKLDVPSGGRDYSKVMDDSISDDVDSNATRSLFVGNIPKNISIYELRDIFQRYGPILVSGYVHVTLYINSVHTVCVDCFPVLNMYIFNSLLIFFSITHNFYIHVYMHLGCGD